MFIFDHITQFFRHLSQRQNQVDEDADREIIIIGHDPEPITSNKPKPEQVAVSYNELPSTLHPYVTIDLLEEVGPQGAQALHGRLIALGLPAEEADDVVTEVLMTLVKLRLSRGFVTEMGDIVKYYSCSQTEDDRFITRKIVRTSRMRLPVSDAELRDVENRLQVQLPGLFLRLYSEVSNGGFGPGYGLESISEIINAYQNDIENYNELDEDAIQLPWPAGLIYLGTEGCTYNYYLDCRDPQYRVLMFSDSHYKNRLEEGMLLLAESFGDWIGHWAMPKWASERFAVQHKVGDVSFPAE